MIHSRSFPVALALGLSLALGACSASDMADIADEGEQVGEVAQDLIAPTGSRIVALRVIADGVSTPAALNLTRLAENLDWVHWGKLDASTVTRRSSPLVSLGNYTKIGTGSINHYTPGPAPIYQNFTWQRNPPVTEESKNGLGTNSVNTGFKLKVPVGLEARTLFLYVTAQDAQFTVNVDAFGSAPARVASRVVGSTRTTIEVQISLNANPTTSTNVSVTLTRRDSANGFMALHAAEISSHPGFSIDARPTLGAEGIVPQPPLYPTLPGGGRLTLPGTTVKFDTPTINPSNTPMYGWEMFRGNERVSEATLVQDLGFREQESGRHQYDLIGVSQNNGRARTYGLLDFWTWSEAKIPVPIPDLGCASVTLKTLFPNPSKVRALDLSFSIGHTYDADLQIYLIAPSGQSVMIADRAGGSLDNYTDARFLNFAGLAPKPSAAAVPFSRVLAPENSMAGFLNEPATGDWTLKACDVASADTGSILWARLYLQP